MWGIVCNMYTHLSRKKKMELFIFTEYVSCIEAGQQSGYKTVTMAEKYHFEHALNVTFKIVAPIHFTCFDSRLK